MIWYAALLVVCGWTVVAGAGADGPNAQPTETLRVFPPTSVYRLTLQKFLNGKHDLIVTLFAREGRPYHAWGIAPTLDQSLHQIDLTPAAPIEYFIEGRRFVPDRSLKGNYDYLKEEFVRYRDQYLQGKLIMRNRDAPPPLKIGVGHVAGVLDVFLDSPDEQQRDRFRVAVNLKPDCGKLTGRFEAYYYDRYDESFSPVGEKFAGGAYIEPLRDYWDHRLERAFAPGTDWPQQHGPTLTGSAVDCRQELVDDISQARLVWIADLPIPGGRGGIPRSPFGFFPINNSGLGATQYSAPIVANGKVYLALPYVDEKLLASSDKVSDHPQVIRGMDPRALAHELKLFRDSLICFDAQTGRTLWMFQDPRHSELLGHSKSGRGLTAVYHNGKVIFRGQHALYAVDAETGKLLWQNDGVKAPKGDDSSYNFAESQAWSTDHSPVLIDGVLVVRINDTPSGPRNQQATQAKHTSLLGLDPESGRLLWRARNVTGENAIAIPVVLGGKTYIVAAYNGDVAVAERLQTARPEEIGMLSLIDPKTGQIVWQEPVVGPNPLYPLVWNDIVALNVERERIQQGPKGKKEVDSTLGAFRLSVTGPEPLWRAAGVDYPSGRTTPIVHHGVLLVDSRETGFQAIDAASGKVLGKFPHIYELAGGSHNWTWIVASNGRAFVSSGDRLLMFRVDNGRFEKMPGELQVDLASGYICPIRPALADGRLFVRTGDGLACYDLRKPMNQ